MKKFVLIPFLFVAFWCNAQHYIPYIQWQNTIGGNGEDNLNQIIPTNDGGYFLAGSSISDISGDKTENHVGGFDFWILKLDQNANILWQKTIDKDFTTNYLTTAKQTRDEGFILAGTASIGGVSDYLIVKVNKSGNVEWSKIIGGDDNDLLYDVIETRDGGYLLGGHSASNISRDKTQNSVFSDDYWIVKVNNVGTIQWQQTIGGTGYDFLYSINQTSDGGYILGGRSGSDSSGNKHENRIGGLNDYDYWVVKTDSIGHIQWENTIGGTKYDDLRSVQQTSDGGYILGGSSSSNISGDKTENDIDNVGNNLDYWIIKLNAQGNIIWQNTIGGVSSEFLYTIEELSDKNFLVSGISKSGINGDKTENTRGDFDYWTLMLNDHGNIIWQKTIGSNVEDNSYNNLYTKTSAKMTRDGGVIIGGYSASFISGDKTEQSKGVDYWVIKLKIITNADTIKGKVFQSQNNNCSQESNEEGWKDVILKTEPYGFYGLTDTSGKYSILTDTGTYKVKQIVPAVLKPFLHGLACPPAGYHTVSFSQFGQDTAEINFANYEKQCPFLQVTLVQSRMRRCFNSSAAIRYCNIGNVDTNNVQVVVQLPEYVSFVSADNPNYTIDGKKITFNIGTLRVNECGAINLITHIDCINGITGLTQCISAYILPRNECIRRIQPNFDLWDRSDIAVDGRCTGSTVRFVIRNTGQNMTDSSSYRIYKDAVLALTRRFKLVAGDSAVINVLATGNTYRLEADQRIYYPSQSTPNSTIENCGTGVASRGFVIQQTQDDMDRDVEKVCLPIRDSYDPNDKEVFPSGVGIENRVPHKVPLKFLIRFQNTGSDTAYKIVITDTLNQNLDLSTLELGAASHPFTTSFTGAGVPILKFTFDKINLVDSVTNEPKSHGFISFKITPYDSIPNGTIVKNNADIYFDFNLPIKTNTTQVTINDNLPTGAVLNIVTSVKQQSSSYEAIYVYPNPFTNTATFEFVNNTKANQLQVYDVKGELIRQENIAHKTTYQFPRNSLSGGMYFYAVLNDEGEIIGRGKLIIQ